MGVMIQMNEKTLDSLEAIKTFLSSSDKLELAVPKEERYEWLASTLKRLNYDGLAKKDKRLVRDYLQKVTHYSRAQLTRLIAVYRKERCLVRKPALRHSFSSYYTREDILLLVNLDRIHQTLSGGLTKKLLERAFEVYKDNAYQRLSKISVSHIYNLRKSKMYQRQRHHFEKTHKTSISIGERRKPIPNGCPGYIRIDTVHQGDKDKAKGVYHINAVDEVTQFEVVVSVEKISEIYLIPALEWLLEEFPFVIINFHSDCGSEYVNYKVLSLLNKLHIEFTKSRSRHCNDNALAESKNGSIVRKYLGYIHINQKYAPLINEFNKSYLIPYLNFHRPCHFPETITDKKGKEKKVYRYKNIMTPYEKLKSLSEAEKFLKPGTNFIELDKKALSMTDNVAAEKLKQAQEKLFREIFGEKQETEKELSITHEQADE